MPSSHRGESLAQERIELNIAIAVHVSALALFVYDFLLSFGREVELMWKRPYQFSTALYFATRYLPFFGLVFEIATINESMSFLHPKSTDGTNTCNVVLYVVDALDILVRGSITVVLVSQTYAIYNQSLAILLIFGSLGFATVILDGLEAAVDTCTLDPPNIRSPLTTVKLVLLATCSIAVMCVTLYKVLSLDRRKMLGCRGTIPGDGLIGVILFETICLSGVCVLRIFNVLLFVCAPTSFNLGADPLLPPISSIFISNFLLSLRSVRQDLKENHTLTKSLAFTTCPFDFNDHSHLTSYSLSEESNSPTASTHRSGGPLIVPQQREYWMARITESRCITRSQGI